MKKNKKGFYNKEKCRKCKYYIEISGIEICDYSKTGNTCLQVIGDNIVDIRGKNSNRCKLFIENK